MISGFIFKKVGMTSVFTPEGKLVPVTKCAFRPLTVTQLKTADKDGYQSVQLAYGQRKHLSKPVSGKLKKLDLSISPAKFKEFKIDAGVDLKIGQELSADQIFQPGDLVRVTGISKGRGFAGVIKRYGFQRQPVTGGQSDRVRAPGAIGAQTPGKVIKGKKMPGHYGNKTKTIQNLKVVSVDKDQNLLTISGPVPGSINSWLIIRK